MLSIDSIVDEVRGFHPNFDRPNVAPVVIRQFVLRAANWVIGQVSEEDPDIVATEGSVPARREGPGGFLDVLEDDDNPENRLSVPPFASLADNIRVGTEGRSRTKVSIVPLSGQYPGPFDSDPPPPFPSIARSRNFFHVTDLRRAGAAVHGWEDFAGPITYHYVPYYEPTKANFSEIAAPTGLRAAIVLRASEQLALRLVSKYPEMRDYYALMTRQVAPEINQVVAQLSHIDVGVEVIG